MICTCFQRAEELCINSADRYIAPGGMHYGRIVAPDRNIDRLSSQQDIYS